MRRGSSLLLAVAAAALVTLPSTGAAERKSAATPVIATKRCHYVVKQVHGKRRRVRVCRKPRPSWDYVALGDSLTTGRGLVSSMQTYPATFARFVTADTKMRTVVNNLALDGAMSADLLAAIKTPLYRAALRSAEIVTVDIGFNDFGGDVIAAYAAGRCGGTDNEDCLRAMITQFRANLDAILDEVVADAPPSKGIVRVLDQYNNLIGNSELAFLGPTFGETIGKKYTEAMNDETCASAAAHGIACADVYHAFNGPAGLDNLFLKDVLADGDHPNARGHRLIADVLRALGYAPKRPA